jgi:general secretion pathway protein D
MKEIDDVVASLDSKTKEVLIEVKIIKVDLNDGTTAQISWDGLFQKLNQYGSAFVGSAPLNTLARTGTSTIANFTNIAPTVTPGQAPLSVFSSPLYVGNVDPNGDAFETLINFLRTLGSTKILSEPRLAVVNNQEAKIHVGTKQAYVTTTTTTGQTTTTTAESVTFVDVGIQFAVTPTINDDGFVSMKIKPEVSSVTSFLTTPSGNKIPIIDSSLAETSVMVKDGISILIGGLKEDTATETRNKVPILGDIPWLGAPFNSSVNNKVHSELLIMITPHIVYGESIITPHGENNTPSVPPQPFLTFMDYPTLDVSKKDTLKGVR